MLTPKQTRLLNHPNVQLLITSLQCEPTLSAEFKYSKAVEARVSQILNTMEKAVSLPVVKRSVSVEIEDTTPFKKIDLSACIEVEHTFKSWKSMAGKTIKAPF